MPSPPAFDTAGMPTPSGVSSVIRPSPASASVRADVAALSHAGHVRPNNEDHFLVVRFGRFLEPLLTNLPAGESPLGGEEVGYGMVVADGMGGMAAGEVASRLAIQTLVSLVLDVPDWILRPEAEFSEEILRRAAERYRQVSAALTEEAAANPRLYGMGTTMTMACSLGANLFLAHVGDSRVYVYRNGKLRQLTRDHTMAQAMADRGLITQEAVATSRLRHMLTQALGGKSQALEPEVRHLRLADGDCLLLCTDGLTDMVEEPTIGAEIARGDAAEPTCRRLVELALKNGGKDNVTVVVARYRLP